MDPTDREVGKGDFEHIEMATGITYILWDLNLRTIAPPLEKIKKGLEPYIPLQGDRRQRDVDAVPEIENDWSASTRSNSDGLRRYEAS